MTARHERSPYAENHSLSEPATTVRPAHSGRNAGVEPLQSGYALPARPHPRVLIMIDAGFSPCLSRCRLHFLTFTAGAFLGRALGCPGSTSSSRFSVLGKAFLSRSESDRCRVKVRETFSTCSIAARSRLESGADFRDALSSAATADSHRRRKANSLRRKNASKCWKDPLCDTEVSCWVVSRGVV